MLTPLLIAFGSALALGHCFFLAIYCWQAGSEQPALRWLAALLLALAVRLLKSVCLVLFADVPYVVPATGLVGMTTIGPFLWYYIRQSLHPNQAYGSFAPLHFLLSVAVLVWQFFEPSDPVILGQYVVAAGHLAGYLFVSGRAALRAGVQPPVRAWLTRLFGGLGLIWLVFVAQLVSPAPGVYVVITLTAAAVLYGLSFWGLRHGAALTQSFRPKPTTFDASLRAIGHAIEELMRTEHLYRHPDLTIQKLAYRLKQPAHRTSKAINQTFGQTFPELLTTYRVRAAAERLIDPARAHLTVEAIATECGFNSLSTFYAAFKKTHGLTPAGFQRRHRQPAAPGPA